MIPQVIMKNLLLSIFLLGLFSITYLQAQPLKKVRKSSRFVPKEFSVSAHYGSIINNGELVSHLSSSHPAGFEVNASWLTTGKHGWEAAYGFPQIGLSLFYFDFRNPILGEAWALVPFMKWRLSENRRSRLEFKLGPGVVYTNNPWTIHSNPKNLMFSSKFNNVMYMGLEYNYRINSRIKLHTGLDLSHYSNAAYSLPNASINIPSLSLGVTYTPHTEHVVLKDSLANYEKKWSFHALVSGSIIELDANQARKNHIVSITALASKRVGRKSALNIGIEYSRNTALEQYARRLYTNAQQPVPDFRRVAIVAGHELLAGRLALVTQLGYYVYRPFSKEPDNTPVDMPIYQRYGMKYYFHKHFFGQYTFKTYLGVAEAIEWSLGYYF